MKRVLSVYLPSFPLQRLAHEQPALRSQAVVLIAPHAPRGPRVELCSRRAAASGVQQGMPLAEALALDAGLVIHEQNLERDRHGLLQLAKAAECYSPVVALEEGPNPQGLLIDVTGCAPCFGGEDKLLQRAGHELTQQGWLVRLALADTVGAAWGLARFARSPCLAPPGATTAVLKPLPVAALRLSPETLIVLAQLGLKKIGDLLSLPRPDLTIRFGPLLLLRLDQALGLVPEMLVPPGAEPELQAEEELDFPTERWEVLFQVLERLATQLHEALCRRNLGARQLACWLYHETATATRVEVGLYRPSASPRYLGMLLRTRLERLQLAAPVCAVRLGVPCAETIPERQQALFETASHDEQGLALLIDRLSNLLGGQTVTRPRCLPDSQPEYAFRFESLLQPQESKHAVVPRRKGRAEPEVNMPLEPRPLCLWPEPVRIDVMALFPDGAPLRYFWAGSEFRVARWWGPERIETGWWRGEDIHRDYYVVMTDQGSRFWMFRRRDDGSWFLHGCFD